MALEDVFEAILAFIILILFIPIFAQLLGITGGFTLPELSGIVTTVAKFGIYALVFVVLLNIIIEFVRSF